MTEAKPLSAEEISGCRTLAWADDEKWTSANVRHLIATIEQRDEQIRDAEKVIEAARNYRHVRLSKNETQSDREVAYSMLLFYVKQYDLRYSTEALAVTEPTP